MNVSEADLDWWWDLAPRLTWTFAKSMPRAPHWYVVADKRPDFCTDDLMRVLALIRRFGEPSKFYSRTNLELISPDRVRRVWCQIETPIRYYKPVLVNLAKTDRTYGEQADFNQAFLVEVALPPGRLG